MEVLDTGDDWMGALKRHLLKNNATQAAFADELPWLIQALAEYTAQERFRRAVPNNTQVDDLKRIKHRAGMLRKAIEALSVQETEWLLARALPIAERDTLLERLTQLEQGPDWTIEYQPAASAFDDALRQIWTRLTGQRPTINNAADDADSESKPSPFHEFVRLVCLAIPDDVRPGEAARTLSARPRALKKQRVADSKKGAEMSQRLRDLHHKLFPKS